MKEEIVNKLTKLIGASEFEEKLSMCENETQILELFSANGLEVTEEELKELMAYATEANDGELEESQLETVSGGKVGLAVVLIKAGFEYLKHKLKK